MPLTFPSSPINGAVSGDYTYDATKGAWRKNAAYPVSVTHSDVAPSNPRVGDQWWKSNEGTLFTYYNDGTSSQWVESTNVVANVEPNPIPAGAMMAWGSDIIPANWLLCDGSAVSRSTYASLFAIIGTQYGSGDGTTTFNLPNIKGRTIVGKDASQTEFDVLGETGGAKTHTLLTSEMPSHTHTQDAHSHTYSGTTSTGGGHSHTVYGISGFSSSGAGYLALQSDGNLVWYRGNGTTWASGQGAGGSLPQMFVGANQSTTTSSNGDHSHTFSGTTSSSTATNQNTGGGGAHNNLQPYIVLNYIIKFSAGETPGDSQLATRVSTLETQNNSTPLSPNYVINGGFDIWQRGTSATTDAANTHKSADRWCAYKNNAGATESRQSAGLTGFQYCGRYQRNSGSSDTQQLWAYQTLESLMSIPLAGKTVTLSFYARAGANYSAASSGLLVQLRSGTGIDQNALSGFTGSATPINQTATLTTSWQRFSYTGTLASNITQLGVVFIETPTGTAGAADYFEITGVQLEEGSYATPFRRNGPSIQAELAACQRYYWRLTSTGAGYPLINAHYYVANAAYGAIQYPVPMRANATVTCPTFNGWTIWSGGTSRVATSFAVNNSRDNGATIAFGSSAATVGAGAWVESNSTATFIDFSAEL